MAVADTGGMEINQQNPIGARYDEAILDPPGRRVGPGMLAGIGKCIVAERGSCQRHRLACDDSPGSFRAAAEKLPSSTAVMKART